MADQNNELETLRQEVETLRRTNAELVTKNSTRKTRIAELESARADTQAKLDAANGTIHEILIGAPLKSMAEDISTCPELWTEQFSKAYRLELVNDELTVMSIADGKPLMKDGTVVPFERDPLVRALTDETHPQAKVFRSITIASRASGSGAGSTIQRTQAPAVPKPSARQFGLR